MTGACHVHVCIHWNSGNWVWKSKQCNVLCSLHQVGMDYFLVKPELSKRGLLKQISLKK